MALATLSVDLVAKVAKFEADLGRVARTAEANSERMAAAFGLAKSALGGLVAGLATGASVAFFRNIVNGIDALNDLADATGSSVENLSALEDVAARTGTSFDTVGSALLKLNKTLADAKPGSDAAAALDALGLSAKELKQLDPAEALRRTAVALAGFADDGNKARLTQELFGKSLKEVAPLLNDLAKVNKLNATLTEEQVKAAEAFNLELFRLQKSAVDLARELAGPLVASINKTIEAFRQGGKEKGFLEKLEDDLRSRLTFEDLTKRIANLQTQLAIEPKGTGIYAAIEREIAEKTKLLQATEKGAQAAFRPSQNYGDAFKPSAPVIGGGDPRGAAAPKPRSVDPFIDPATTDAIRALGGTDVAKIVQLNAQLTELFSLQRESKGAPGVAEAIAKTREELAKLDPAAVAAAKAQTDLNTILAGTPSGQMAALAQQASILAIELAKATDPEKIALLNEALVQTGDKMRGLNEEAEVLKDELTIFAEQAARNIQDALGDTLESALSGNFESIGELWGNLLKRMVAQAIASQLNNALFGSLGGGTGKGAGLIGTFFGLSGARANGGPVSAGGAYLVGEKGPEIFTPKNAGTILPNGVGMGGVTINQTLNVGAGVSRGEVAAALSQAGQQIKADVMQTLYRTGRGAYA